MTSKDDSGAAPSRTEQAKQLLKQYGSAYLVTSISFAVVSFAACYAAVSAGARRAAGGWRLAAGSPVCALAHATAGRPASPSETTTLPPAPRRPSLARPQASTSRRC
jgi:hypothetical protein